jgi:hypothetical protein
MKKFNKRLICLFVLMALTFSFSIVATAETTDKVTGYDHGLQKQNMPDALNPTLEKEKLNEYMENNQSHVYTNNGNIIKLAPNEKIILSFDDGSRIEYSLRVEANSVNSERNYDVDKTYFYLTGSATVGLHARCTHSNREVTIDDLYDSFQGSLAKRVEHDTDIIREKGFQGTYAIGEGWGVIQFELPQVGDYFQRSYRIQIQIDPAGGAYLVVLD